MQHKWRLGGPAAYENNESANRVNDRADAADNEDNVDQDNVIKVVTQTIGMKMLLNWLY